MTLDARPPDKPAAFPQEIRFRNGQWQLFCPFRYGVVACAPTRVDLQELLDTKVAPPSVWLTDSMPRSRPKQFGGRQL